MTEEKQANLTRQYGKSWTQQMVNLADFVTIFEQEHNLKNFFIEMAKDENLRHTIEEITESANPLGNAVLFLGYDPETKYGKSYMEALMERSVPKNTDYLDSLGSLISLKYQTTTVIVGETGPAKPEPDWKHPIPVSVKSDGPSKQKRTKLRAKRKK